MAGPLPRRLGEELPAYCWCECNVIPVAVTKIRAGCTESCGAPDCVPPRESECDKAQPKATEPEPLPKVVDVGADCVRPHYRHRGVRQRT